MCEDQSRGFGVLEVLQRSAGRPRLSAKAILGGCAAYETDSRPLSPLCCEGATALPVVFQACMVVKFSVRVETAVACVCVCNLNTRAEAPSKAMEKPAGRYRPACLGR
jgi:hypothetical protein